MKKTYLIPLLLIGAICLAVVAAQTQPRPERPERPMRHAPPSPHGPQLFEALELSAEQRDQIKAIHRETAKKKARKKADIRIARLDLEALMDQEKPDRKKIHDQIKEIAALRAQMKILQVDQHLEIQQTLGPEQRERFKKMNLKRHREPHPREPHPREPHH